MKLKVFLLLFLFLFPLIYSDEQNYQKIYDEYIALKQKLLNQISESEFNEIIIPLLQEFKLIIQYLEIDLSKIKDINLNDT